VQGGERVRVEAVDHVEAEVRELVRRRGLDPAVEAAAVRRLVDEVLGDYEERTLTSDLPALGDRLHSARAVYDAVAGYGPLQRHLDDPEVEEIWINEPGRVFVARRGRSELTTTILAPGQVPELVERMLRTSGRRVDLSTPFVDAMLPDGSRLHVAIPDITRQHWAVNIRKFVVRAHSLDELVELGSLTLQAAAFLDAAVVAGLNIIVAGGTQAGKTTLLNCLLSAVPARERVVTCEEVFELRVPLPDVVALQTRQPNLEGTGEVRLRRLVKEALRMRPDRIVVGEVRQEEARVSRGNRAQPALRAGRLRWLTGSRSAPLLPTTANLGQTGPTASRPVRRGSACSPSTSTPVSECRPAVIASPAPCASGSRRSSTRRPLVWPVRIGRSCSPRSGTTGPRSKGASTTCGRHFADAGSFRTTCSTSSRTRAARGTTSTPGSGATPWTVSSSSRRP
jgi:Flp pilus assembly CpaF family ATPase